MKIAITGCNGSIGSRVVLRALELGHSVVGIDATDRPGNAGPESDRFEFHKVNLTVFEDTLAALKGCDAIVQLAGIRQPIDYLVKTHNTNVVITWNILRGAAELGITRISQASSVNVIPMIFSNNPHYDYFPLDEDHPCLPDEPYGLSKVIAEMQASTIVRRYVNMRVASFRLPWSLPYPDHADTEGQLVNEETAVKFLWAWVHEDDVAEAFLLGLADNNKWKGHEAFFIAAPQITVDVETMDLKNKHFPNVPVKDGKLSGREGFFDCGKAERILGWKHR